MSRALEIVIAHHVATAVPLILEGDCLLPALAARRVFAGLEVGDQLRAVFIVEPDEAHLLKYTRTRTRGGFPTLTAAEQARRVRVSWLYGRWLAEQAHRHGLPVVTAHPWATLHQRITTAVR